MERKENRERGTAMDVKMESQAKINEAE